MKKQKNEKDGQSFRLRMAPEKEFRALVRIAAALQAICLLVVFGVTEVLAKSSNFDRRGQVSLSVFVRGEGTVTSLPEGLSCNDGVCTGTFRRHTVVRLIAQPAEGQILSRWRGACEGSRDECRVRLRGPQRVVATFRTPPPIPLKVFLRGEGTVISDPKGLECSNRVCRGMFPQGSVVALHAVPGENQSFRRWRGACRGNEDCVVTMRKGREILARFTNNPPPETMALTVSIKGNGTVAGSPDGLQCVLDQCKGEFPIGTTVTLTPKPGEEQVFTEWGGACQGHGLDACSVTLTAPVEVTAAFVLLPPPNVDLAVMVTGEGTVTSNPPGISCPTENCTASFQSGTEVTLTAVPSAEHAFSGWTGACSGMDDCMVTLSAATVVSANFVPSSTGGLTDAEAIRFLEQSTWGPNPSFISRLKEVGIDAFLTEQFQAAPSAYPEPSAESDSLSPLHHQWFFNAFHGGDQLRQRVAFALSQLFVVSANTVGTDEQMIPYQRMLHENAFGNFLDLMRMVTLSPTMGRFLDMVDNDKTDPASGLNPNENYARELLQLFTVGTTLLNPDGSNRLDANGQPIPPYEQDVIVNLSRVFTGWTFPTMPGALPRWRNPAHYNGPMEAFDDHHDMTEKILMNGFTIPPNGTAQQDLEAALNHIFFHPNVGPFVATRLIRNLVTSNPSSEYIQRVAAVFNDDQSGNGARGNMQAVIKAILTDPEAATVTPNGGHLREPILFAIALLRALNADVQSDNVLYDRTRDMGQTLFSPPSVFNYFSPLYKIPGTTLFGPEYQIHTLSSTIARVNFVDRVVNNNVGTGVTVNLSAFAAVADDVERLIDAVARALLHEPLPEAERQIIRDALIAINDPTTRAGIVVYLIATSGRYQAQH